MVVELELCVEGFVSEDHRVLMEKDLRVIGGFDSEGMEYGKIVSETNSMGGDYFCRGDKREIIVYKSRE